MKLKQNQLPPPPAFELSGLIPILGRPWATANEIADWNGSSEVEVLAILAPLDLPVARLNGERAFSLAHRKGALCLVEDFEPTKAVSRLFQEHARPLTAN